MKKIYLLVTLLLLTKSSQSMEEMTSVAVNCNTKAHQLPSLVNLCTKKINELVNQKVQISNWALLTSEAKELVLSALLQDHSIMLWAAYFNKITPTTYKNLPFIRGIKLSKDNEVLVIYSEHLINIINRKYGTILFKLEDQDRDIMQVEISADNSFLVIGFYQNGAQIWDINTASLITEFNNGLTTWATISPNNNFIVTRSPNNPACIWDAKTGRALAQMPGYNNVAHIGSLSISSDNQFIVVGSILEATICDHTGKLLATLPGHKQFVLTTAISNSSELIATSSIDGELYVWDRAGNKKFDLKMHSGNICTTAFSPCSRFLASGADDNTCCIWDMETGELTTQLIGHKEGVRSVRFSEDSHMVITVSLDLTARLWDRKTGTCIGVLEQVGPAESIVLTKDNSALFAGHAIDDNFGICCWDIADYLIKKPLDIEHIISILI